MSVIYEILVIFKFGRVTSVEAFQNCWKTPGRLPEALTIRDILTYLLTIFQFVVNKLVHLEMWQQTSPFKIIWSAISVREKIIESTSSSRSIFHETTPKIWPCPINQLECTTLPLAKSVLSAVMATDKSYMSVRGKGLYAVVKANKLDSSQVKYQYFVALKIVKL